MDFANVVYQIVDEIGQDKYLKSAVSSQYLYKKSCRVGISIEDSVESALDSEWSGIKTKFLFNIVGEKAVSTNLAVASLNLREKSADELDYLLVLLKSMVKSKLVYDYKLKNY